MFIRVGSTVLEVLPDSIHFTISPRWIFITAFGIHMDQCFV